MDCLKRKPGIRPGMRLNEKNGAEYLTFPAISETGLVSHLMTTRSGGVSEGELGSMNLSFTPGRPEGKCGGKFPKGGGASWVRAGGYRLLGSDAYGQYPARDGGG